jgi:hypothetical protein
MWDNQSPRIVFIMIDEATIDNLMYARENMEKEFTLKPENISDVIEVLINYWFEGKRELSPN